LKLRYLFDKRSLVESLELLFRGVYHLKMYPPKRRKNHL
jgi:hypothetical protein